MNLPNFSAVPALAWVGLALVTSLGANALQWRAAAVNATKAEARVDKVADANDSSQVTIAALKDSVADCEAGRVFDRAANAAALARRETDRAAIAKDAEAARIKLAVLLDGRCHDWAAQPACGVVP
jgi:hypothetical protein